MENASKALLIAGGVLIAMMILALVVYIATYMSSVADSQDKRLATEQLEEFNKSYLAYNKTRLYGIDVITVVNKAIDYNQRLDTDEEEYKINIILDLKQDFYRTRQTVTQNGNNETEYGAIETLLEARLESEVYQLFERDGSIMMNDAVIEFFHQPSNDETTKTYGTTIVTTYEYSAITNFKTAIFTCNNVEYSDEGRVNSMTFTQI